MERQPVFQLQRRRVISGVCAEVTASTAACQSGIGRAARHFQQSNSSGALHELALLAVAGGEGAEKLAVFAHVPDGHAVGPAPGWLNAALAPLGGRGGGKPGFAQGSAVGSPAEAVAAAEAFVSA